MGTGQGACGGDARQSAASPDPDSVPDAVAVTENPPAESTVGAVTFTNASAEKRFEYLPESASIYMRMAATLQAHPEAGSTERFDIRFMSIDLKAHDYLPATLPPPKDLSRQTSPFEAMAGVGFGHTDADGVEWAGPGKIHIESFDNNGVIQGTFDQVTIPHTDNELPGITLTGGSFRARITSPW